MAGPASAVGKLLAEVAKLPNRILQSATLIWVFTMIGVYLVLARYLLMEFAPFGAKHAKIFADFVNILLDLIWGMFQAIRLVISFFVTILRTLEGKHKKHFSVKGKPAHISAEQLRHFLLTVPVECHDFVWTSKELFLWPLQQLLSPVFCPVLRYLWPVPWMYDLVYPVLGWASTDPTPVTGGGNCKQNSNNDWVCVGLGAGFLVLEILVPALIFIMIASPLIAVLIGQALSVMALAGRIAHRVERKVLSLLEKVGAALENVLSRN